MFEIGVLNILDANSFLHTAYNVPELNSLVVRNCPVGGLTYISRKISYLLNRGESVLVAFDSKTNRKITFPEYKKSRKRVPEVSLQSEALYKFLSNSNVCCVKINGLEADDIIYNVVEKELGNYDAINIFSSDYDLCHNVRAGKVNFFSVNRNVLNVTGSNFSEVLSTIDVRVPFNTITAKKVFMGDSSDNISSFSANNGKTGRKLYCEFIDLAFSNGVLPYEILRSRELIETLAPFMGLYEEDIKNVKSRCDLFYPIVKDFDYTISTKGNIDLGYYSGYVKSIKDMDSCRTLKYFGSSNPSVDEELFQYGNSFSSGEYHVDNNYSLTDFSFTDSDVFIRGL